MLSPSHGITLVLVILVIMLYLPSLESKNFINNSANSDGGAICATHNVIITFNGTNKFFTNSAGSDGGVIYARQNMIVSFIGTINHFTHNSACSGGAIYAVDNVALIFNGTNNFVNNSICGLLNGNSGVIYTSGNTVLTFEGLRTRVV